MLFRSAMGAILADVKRDYVRSVQMRLDGSAGAVRALTAAFRALEKEAAAWISREGGMLGEVRFDAGLDMRYGGQAFDLQVPVPDALRRAPDAAAITELFHREHERIYSFRDPESGIEITTLRLRATGRIPPIKLPEARAGGVGAPVATRRVYHAGATLDVPVHLRRDLGAGARIAGPAIIEQEDCTAWVLPGWTAEIHPVGSIVISRD